MIKIIIGIIILYVFCHITVKRISNIITSNNPDKQEKALQTIGYSALLTFIVAVITAAIVILF